MIKAIVFDSDGMLLHGTRFSDAYSAEFGVSIEEMTPFFTGPFKDCIIGRADLKEELSKDWLQKWHWKGTVDELIEYWFTKGSEPNREILDTIPKLKSNGVICLLATNQEKYRYEFFLERMNFRELFDKTFSSSEIGCKKSETPFMETMMKYLGNRDTSIKKENVLFWDDRTENIESVKEFGYRTAKYTDAKLYQYIMHRYGLL